MTRRRAAFFRKPSGKKLLAISNSCAILMVESVTGSRFSSVILGARRAADSVLRLHAVQVVKDPCISQEGHRVLIIPQAGAVHLEDVIGKHSITASAHRALLIVCPERDALRSWKQPVRFPKRRKGKLSVDFSLLLVYHFFWKYPLWAEPSLDQNDQHDCRVLRVFPLFLF